MLHHKDTEISLRKFHLIINFLIIRSFALQYFSRIVSDFSNNAIFDRCSISFIQYLRDPFYKFTRTYCERYIYNIQIYFEFTEFQP